MYLSHKEKSSLDEVKIQHKSRAVFLCLGWKYCWVWSFTNCILKALQVSEQLGFRLHVLTLWICPKEPLFCSGAFQMRNFSRLIQKKVNCVFLMLKWVMSSFSWPVFTSSCKSLHYCKEIFFNITGYFLYHHLSVVRIPQTQWTHILSPIDLNQHLNFLSLLMTPDSLWHYTYSQLTHPTLQ